MYFLMLYLVLRLKDEVNISCYSIYTNAFKGFTLVHLKGLLLLILTIYPLFLRIIGQLNLQVKNDQINEPSRRNDKQYLYLEQITNDKSHTKP